MKLLRAILLTLVPIIATEAMRGCNERAVARERADELNRQLGDAQRQIEALNKSAGLPTAAARPDAR